MVDVTWSEEKIMNTNLNMYIEYILFRYNNFLKENIKNQNITLGDLTYLINISYNEGISQKNLSDLLFVSEANVAKFLKKLENKGYIKRYPSEDNKSIKLVYLTNEGKSLVDDLTKMNDEWERNITDFLSEKEVFQLKSVLFELSKRSADF